MALPRKLAYAGQITGQRQQSQYGSANGGATGSVGKVIERVHSVSYHATEHKLILDVETDQTKATVKSGKVGDITIQNTGGTSAFAILVYKVWSDATTMTGNVYHLNGRPDKTLSGSLKGYR